MEYIGNNYDSQMSVAKRVPDFNVQTLMIYGMYLAVTHVMETQIQKREARKISSVGNWISVRN